MQRFVLHKCILKFYALHDLRNIKLGRPGFPGVPVLYLNKEEILG